MFEGLVQHGVESMTKASFKAECSLDSTFELLFSRISLPHDFAGTIHQESLRNSTHAISVKRGVAFQADTVTHRRTFQESLDALPILFRKTQDLESLVSVFPLKFIQMWDALNTGSAPGSPK